MKYRIVCLCIIVLVWAFLSPVASSQTHNNSAAGVFNPNAPMPKNPSQMYFARFIEYAVGIFRKHHEAGAITGLPEGFHYTIRQWQQRDVTDFAGCRETFDTFETLLGIANQALESDPQGQSTGKAIEAQQALTYLKPDCCKSWKGFFNMIANAANETQSIRDRYRQAIKRHK